MLELYQVFEQVRDFMERGGPILTWIGVTTFIMWVIIIERLIYFAGPSRREIEKAYAAWEARKERKSWYAHQIRQAMVSQIRMNLNAGLPTIKTLTAICPLLGLLGTVTGMIVVFDVMALLGSGNVRAMASGVSRATIPTMSGMVAALSGVFAMTYLQRRARAQTALLEDHLTMDH